MYDRKRIERALTQKGFIQDTGKNSDHRYYRFMVDGKESQIRTKISTGTGYKDYSDSLLKMMRYNLKFDSMKQFKAFIECPFTEEEYRELLLDKGVID